MSILTSFYKYENCHINIKAINFSFHNIHLFPWNIKKNRNFQATSFYFKKLLLWKPNQEASLRDIFFFKMLNEGIKKYVINQICLYFHNFLKKKDTQYMLGYHDFRAYLVSDLSERYSILSYAEIRLVLFV